MDCYQASSEMYQYIDGELHVWRRVRVRAHLERCPVCQKGHDFEIGLRQHVRRSCVVVPPEDLAAKIQRALDD